MPRETNALEPTLTEQGFNKRENVPSAYREKGWTLLQHPDGRWATQHLQSDGQIKQIIFSAPAAREAPSLPSSITLLHSDGHALSQVTYQPDPTDSEKFVRGIRSTEHGDTIITQTIKKQALLEDALESYQLKDRADALLPSSGKRPDSTKDIYSR